MTRKIFKVGIIIGSQRIVRIAPQVATFVLETLKTTKHAEFPDTTTLRHITFDPVDIREHNLPMFDESGIPNQSTSPENYKHEHTRAWSRRIAALDAFIFVTGERNWGIPAELKNAIDYLFHEWAGKPAWIVTYGGRGGRHCAAQLDAVLRCVGMDVSTKTANMSFPTVDFRVKALRGEDLGLDANDDTGAWAEHRVAIVDIWRELVGRSLTQLPCQG